MGKTKYRPYDCRGLKVGERAELVRKYWGSALLMVQVVRIEGDKLYCRGIGQNHYPEGKMYVFERKTGACFYTDWKTGKPTNGHAQGWFLRPEGVGPC